MRKFLLTALYAIALMAPLPAFALSVDRDSGMNTDGTPKFADPDEQMPNFMNGSPQDEASAHAPPSIGLPMTPNGTAGFTVNHIGPSSHSDAFDQAYDRK